MNLSRVNRVIENMAREGLDQILISATPSVYYLTGEWISPGERMLALYLNSDGDVMLYANRLFALSGRIDAPLTEFDDTDDPVALLAARVRPGRIGIDKCWPSQFTIRLMQARPDVAPALGSAPVDDARMCKDAAEIELLRESSRLNDQALLRTIGCIREGMCESELAACYGRNARELGADGGSFDAITCFGANCAQPHHSNDETTLKRGDSIILDVGLLYRRYVSDMTRTVFLGGVSDEQRRVYEAVKAANAAGRAAVRPGVRMCEFDRAARRVIEDAGYGKYFIHRTGHGVGLEVHEPPDNSATNQTVARPGMCFSVEPGVYLPGRFGVRIEDLVIVTEDGCETLNRLDHELTIL